MRCMLKDTQTLSLVGVIIWMGLIFYSSDQPGAISSGLSTGILETVLSFIPFIVSDMEVLHLLIRKSAHFFAYLILGLLVIHALRSYHISRYQILWAIGICILYAVTDEVHQLFIPGRSGEVLDVFIDSAGALSGIGIYFGVRRLFVRR